MIKTVIFDMDGVIVDTEPVHRYAYFKQFGELNISVSEDLYTTFTGFSTRNTFQTLKNIFPSIKEGVEDLIQRKRAIFNDAFDTKQDLYLLEGVEELIKDLHKNGIELILASSASKVTINRVFTRFNLHQYFKAVVSGEDFPKSKPDPAIFNHAASLAIGSKEECVIIEDSANGVRAGKDAGIYCIGYLSANSHGQDLSAADLIINEFSELNAEIIANL